MPYPAATDADIAFFAEHGWIVVDDAVDPADLALLEERCQQIIDHKESMAFDWAWEKGQERDQREFKILQSSPSLFWSDFEDAKFRLWAVEFVSALMGQPLEFWYDQFLAKPPQRSVATRWHQDEAYWGRLLDDKGITCWMPMHDVDPANGCMHFIDGGHRDGVLEHRNPAEVQSDLLACAPDESRSVACPLKVGGVTFHHSKTPHMTPPNVTDAWRRILTQHLKAVGVEGEGDHYPWKVFVNQITGERTVPESVMTSVAGATTSAALEAGQRALAHVEREVHAAAARFAATAPALERLLAVRGRVVVTGLGKSGLVGAKLAATLASTGTPAFFVHAADALHGDAGMVAPDDLLLAISKSGTTAEVVRFAEVVRARGVEVVAITGCGGGSPLCALASATIDIGVESEADPFDLVPTTSTAVTAVVGDALAVALMVARGFGPADFHQHHPGGALGALLEDGGR